MIEKILNAVFAHEDLPFGRRWRIAGAYLSPKTDSSGSVLKRGLPWFEDCNLYLHKMVRPDADRDCHNHAYNYSTLILRGGYQEMVQQGDALRPVWHRPGEFFSASAERFHRVSFLPEKRAWTLFFAGKPRWMVTGTKRVHRWGFLTSGGYVPWTEYKRGEP